MRCENLIVQNVSDPVRKITRRHNINATCNTIVSEYNKHEGLDTGCYKLVNIRPCIPYIQKANATKNQSVINQSVFPCEYIDQQYGYKAAEHAD